MTHPATLAPGAPVYQYLPPPFDLAEEVSLAGTTFRQAKARVYSLLQQTAQRGFRHQIGLGGRLGPPGWVPRHLLVEPWSGGAAGDRRVRDLRGLGCEIEIRDWSELGGPRDSDTTLYRLVRAPQGPRSEASTPAPPGPRPIAHHSPRQDPATDPASTETRRHLAAGRDSSPGGCRPGGGGGRPAPLAGCRYRLARGWPPEGVVVRVRLDPGLPNGYAPAAGLAARAAAGELSAEQADELYRDRLREVYATTGFADLRHQVVGFYTSGELEGWDPLPVIDSVMRALGATPMDGEEG